MPRYGHRSDPQTQVAEMRMTASVGFPIFGASRSSKRTSRGPYRTAPFISPSPSTVAQLFDLFRVTGSMHRNRGGGTLDVAKIVRRKIDRRRSDVFFQPVQLRRSRNGSDPRLLRKQPGKRNLGRRSIFPLRDLVQQFHQRLIRFQSLWRKAWQDASEVGAVELRVLFNLAGQEA